MESNEELTFQGSCVRYACHLNCWDGIEEIESTVSEKDKPNRHYSMSIFAEERYKNIPKENLIIFSIYSVAKTGETCSLERLIKECFALFPKSFGFSRYPEWPDSLKFDRPLRTLRERGWIVGGAKVLFSLTKFGEKIAKETEDALTASILNRKPAQKSLRGADTNLVNFLKESLAFKKFLEDRKSFSITEMELRGLLRCTLETPQRVLRQNLQYSKNLAKEYREQELFDFLEICEQILTKERI